MRIGKLTEKQKSLIENNMQRLVDFACYQTKNLTNSNNSLMEECRCVAYEYLCYAAQNYNERKGAFDNFALAYMRWGIWLFLKKEYSRGMTVPNDTNSQKLKNIIFVSGDKDLVQNDGRLDATESFIDLLARVNDDEKVVLSLLIDGMSVPEISKSLLYSNSNVYRIISELRKKAVKSFELENRA